MASFHVVSCEPELLSEGVANYPEDGNLYKIWTISSTKQVKALSLSLPGVVFIEYDAKLGLSSAPAQPASSDTTTSGSDTTQPEEAQGRVVAEVIVVSDSIELLESLELVPLDDEKENQGFEFRVKNQNAELKGSLITNVWVSDKHALTDLICNSAEVVLDSAVLVLDDPEADVQLCACNGANLYLSSHQGLSLRSLSAVVHGTGRCQLLTPSINIQNMLGLIVWGPSIMLLLCPAISASIITSAVIKDGDVGVYTKALKADDMFSVVGLSGVINFTGYGAVLRQTTGVGVNGEVNTGRIMSGTATAYFGWSGRALVQAVHDLDVKSLFSGTVEYANPKPAAITESSWLWWRADKTPSEIVKPTTNPATKLYEVRNPPPRQLMPVHYFVNRGKFYINKGKIPGLIRAEEYSWTSRYSTELGVAATVGAVALFVARRRSAQLAHQMLKK